ncbi:hypothetical protein ECHLIB_0439 [Ehrlichia chaffeensis str. Liberty]|nr:hypothetical protein ECHLIB_0439 [Ehrlichia chaffeensis str. Liberty]AHX08832.1 hypothetical protein ECHSTV_0431 [Ehrlichia chaffeensis str. Saint Vincent]AHX09085.1 hypothetical protein ECHWAK_0438 [Ehrlichia chaffeensis str. Wakulla]
MILYNINGILVFFWKKPYLYQDMSKFVVVEMILGIVFIK